MQLNFLNVSFFKPLIMVKRKINLQKIVLRQYANNANQHS